MLEYLELFCCRTQVFEFLVSHLLNKSYGIQSEEACDQVCFRDLFLDKMIHKAQHSLLSLQFEY